MGPYNIQLGSNYISFAFDGEKEVTGQEKKVVGKKLNGEGKANLQNYNLATKYRRKREYFVKKVAKIENRPTQFYTLLFATKYALNEQLKIFEKFKRWLREQNGDYYFLIKLEINKNNELHLHIFSNCNDVEKIKKKWSELNRNKDPKSFHSMTEFSLYYLTKKEKRNRDLKLLGWLNGGKIFTTINEKNITYQTTEKIVITEEQKEEVTRILAEHAEKQGSLSARYENMLNSRYGRAINLPPDVMAKINFILLGQEEHF